MMQSAIRILVVDDESAIRRALRPPLMELGFQVAEASRGEEALQALRNAPHDVVLLDINMPGIGGIETLKRIRSFAPRLPVLMLTVRDDEEDKVEALELGADDYVTKPFSTRELIARIRSAVRRVRAPARPEDAPIEIGEIRLEPAKRLVTKRGTPVKLTRKEFDILYCLMSRAGRVVTYAKLLTAVWGAESREEVEYLRTFVRQLRKKIEDDPSNPLYLLTDVYVGYRFADAQMFQDGSAVAGEAEEDKHEPVEEHEPKDALSCDCRRRLRFDRSALFVVMQQAEDVVLTKALAAFQEVELDGKTQPGDHAAQLLHQLHRALHRAAGGEQIVHQHHTLSGRDGVGVDLERVRAVLEVVGNAHHRRGQFSGLSDWNKAGVETIGQRGAEDESARLDAQHQVDFARNVVRGQRIDQLGESRLILEQRGDVVKKNPRLGKVRHGANEFLQILDVDGFCCFRHVGA